jgi:hypothetical protein
MDDNIEVVLKETSCERFNWMCLVEESWLCVVNLVISPVVC